MNKNNKKLNKFLNTNKVNKGFTLVELVVTITIIAILSGASVATYIGYTTNARNTVARAEASDVKTIYSVWYADSYTSRNDLFTNLDNFRDYLVTNEKFSPNPNERNSINYYVEAESLTSDYLVTMYYTVSNGMVSEFKLGADATNLNGKIDIVKTNYSSINNALKGKTVLGGTEVATTIELTQDALQYKWVNNKIETNIKVVEAYQYTGYNTAIPFTEENPYSYTIADEDKVNRVIQTSNNREIFIGAGVAQLEVLSKDNVVKAIVQYYRSMYGLSETDMSDSDMISMLGIESVADELFTSLDEFEELKFMAFRTGQKFIVNNPYESESLILSTVDNMTVLNQQNAGDASLRYAATTVNQKDYTVVNYKTIPDNQTRVYINYGTTTGSVEGIEKTFASAMRYANDNGKTLVVNPSFSSGNSITLPSEIKSNSKLLLGVYEDSLIANQTFIKTDSRGNVVKTNYSTDKKTTPEYKVTLTENLVVEGHLQLGGSIGSVQPYSGFTAQYVELEIPEGITLTVKSGGVLESFGRITGKGNIVVETGGEVIEPMEIKDFRGGNNATYALLTEGVIPFNKYIPDNIDVEMTFNSGATYTLSPSILNMTMNVEFIGPNGIFSIASGTMKKSISEGRLQLAIDGEVNDSQLVIEALGRQIDCTDSSFPLYNTDVYINGGTTSFDKLKIKVLPGSQVQIAQGANLVIGEEAGVGVYKQSEFTYYDGIYRVDFSSFANMPDAIFINNGNMTINGSFGGNMQLGAIGSYSFGENAKYYTDFKEAYKMGSSADPHVTNLRLEASVDGTILPTD